MPLNPIHQLVSSTMRWMDGSYLIVLQHSLHQRHEMASETTDEKVYRRAGVRTPAQNAQRDFLGTRWLQLLSKEYKKTIWVQTTNVIPIDLDNVTILNAASNPFGWEEDDADTLTLEDLQGLADAIQNETEKQKRPIVVESLTPILMRHGLLRTLAWLRQLEKCKTTIIVPVLIEALSPTQHHALEDMAQAVLYLQGGDMTMIRQGVRERGNVLRDMVLFEVHTSEANGTVSIEIVNQEDTKEQLVMPSSTTALITLQLDDGEGTSASRPGKVKLQLEDDNAPPSIKGKANRPHIYVQDNDPEFEDMDEEDPDDDLDI